MPRRAARPWQREPDSRRQTFTPRRGVRTHRVDLHGYDVAAAVDYASTAVREAYENGYQFIELLHGAADVTEAPEGDSGRGGIKWELRRLLDAGRFNTYSLPAHQSQVMEGMMRLTLRANPQPRPEAWTEPPKRRYPKG